MIGFPISGLAVIAGSLNTWKLFPLMFQHSLYQKDSLKEK